ncbi:MAG: sulfopyruvate decarboxylase subunit beta [Euryarchaeota archaeon]|nr:sulfopyruvate decarboxylase subunit beta [Euryarchaeota archaeon]
MHEEEVLDLLASEGVDTVVTLPCDRTKDLCSLIPKYFHNITLSREEDGVGICAGLCLAGKKPVLHMQSSGLGNSLNAIMSLSVLYELPLPVIASHRGVYNELIPAQIPFNSALPGVLSALGISFTIIHDASEIGLIADVIRDSYERSRPHVALISPKVWEGERPSRSIPVIPAEESFPVREIEREVTFSGCIRRPVMTRADAIGIIAEELRDELVVSNIGVPSKELYAARDRKENFYMFGSYTQATPIGLGLALGIGSGTRKDVIVLDGDGSLLGTAVLPVVAAENPGNLTVVCLDNGAFGSTGNQITHAYAGVDMELLAIASGVVNTVKVDTPEDLRDALREKGEAKVRTKGARFIHVVIRPGNSDVPNIPIPAVEIKERFLDCR